MRGPVMIYAPYPGRLRRLQEGFRRCPSTSHHVTHGNVPLWAVVLIVKIIYCQGIRTKRSYAFCRYRWARCWRSRPRWRGGRVSVSRRWLPWSICSTRTGAHPYGVGSAAEFELGCAHGSRRPARADGLRGAATRPRRPPQLGGASGTRGPRGGRVPPRSGCDRPLGEDCRVH